jgi:hypothetical protein
MGAGFWRWLLKKKWFRGGPCAALEKTDRMVSRVVELGSSTVGLGI